MAKIQIHPTDSTMYMFWDIATQEPNAFFIRQGHPCWQWNEDFSSPTVRPSILNTSESHIDMVTKKITKPWRNHVFITQGKIEYLSDCTHDLAGKTVNMVDFPEDW